MCAMNEAKHEVTVKELAEFVHRRGDLTGDGGFRRADRAMKGMKGHRRLQQSRGTDYKSEVPVERIFHSSEVSLRVSGRADGVIADLSPMVEEIKTVEARWSKKADPVHFAQLRLYAALLALECDWPQVMLHLTYLELETDKTTTFREKASKDELSAFLNETIDEWFSWLLPYVAWIARRDVSIAEAAFPFPNFRKGQRELAALVYRSIRDKRNCFIEAPTGLGKTLATLYPAIKSLPLLDNGKVFYVTAKTPGRLAARDALERLRSQGVHVRSVSLTAKAKICFGTDAVGCDPTTCPFTKGYHDRYKPAMRELLENECLDKDSLTTIARKHQVCPFELSLDVSAWVDVVIGDYNYVFDPSVMLQRYFGEGRPKHVVLVDEAHNLVDRSREMYSADLSVGQLASPADAGGPGSRKAKTALSKVRKTLQQMLETPPQTATAAKVYHRGAHALEVPPEALATRLSHGIQEIESFLIGLESRSAQLPWLEPWFAMHRMARTLDLYNESYRTVINSAEGRVTLLCLDPSKRLTETLKGLRCAVFFSATLSPASYFTEVLGGTSSGSHQVFTSPFRSEQMPVRIAPIDVSFQARDRSLSTVTQAVAEHLRGSPGNHLIFCPSFAYMEQLASGLTAADVQYFAQPRISTEAERDQFLGKFRERTGSIGLAVLAGVFAEGIDLPRTQLIGVTVIGVGLPGLSLERDLLVDYFDRQDKPGFDYAYRFPGMQRVLQAVGRLIRSEEDHGTVLLIDRRFWEARYQSLLPRWWSIEGG
jgi:DNA excision repair protein ERCC-2